MTREMAFALAFVRLVRNTDNARLCSWQGHNAAARAAWWRLENMTTGAFA
jgi:hypothetical protein